MKLEKLTPEQEQLMLQVRNEWIDLALKGNVKGINKPLFEEGIEWLYKDLLNKMMDYFIQKEEYEQCSAIRDLITSIDNPPLPKPKRK
jgi:hypothetical protein